MSDDQERAGQEGAEPESTNAPEPDATPSRADLHERLTRLEHLTDPRRALRAAGQEIVPAWRRVTRGESRVAVSITMAVAIGLMLALPARVANHPQWLIPALAALLLVGILIANPARLDRPSQALRIADLVLIGVLTGANVASAARLVNDLVHAQGIRNPTRLLLTGAAIWLTNMIVFAFWYWEFDSGGPVVRALNPRPHPDFLFPQMTSPDVTPDHWEPTFVDYLYTSFTNATAFSPTDVLPMSRWVKLTMLVQSVVSLVVVALVIARAVNILK
jgi:uncharacterized membrane protein